MRPLHRHERSLRFIRVRRLQRAVRRRGIVIVPGIDMQWNLVVVIIVGEGRCVARVAVQAVAGGGPHVARLHRPQLGQQLRLVRLSLVAQANLAPFPQLLLLLLKPCQIVVARITGTECKKSVLPSSKYTRPHSDINLCHIMCMWNCYICLYKSTIYSSFQIK